MIQGTNPVHTFKLPFSTEAVQSIRILYAQDDEVVVAKETADCTLEGDKATVELTQEDTLSFNHKKKVEIQVRVLTVDGKSLVSDPKCVTVRQCLDKDVIK